MRHGKVSVMRILIQFLSIVFLLAIQPYTGFGQSRSKVVIGYASMSSAANTLWVAQDRAFVIVDGLKNIQRFMKLRNPKTGQMNLDRLVDESILHEFEKSGFLDQTLSGKTASR